MSTPMQVASFSHVTFDPLGRAVVTRYEGLFRLEVDEYQKERRCSICQESISRKEPRNHLCYYIADADGSDPAKFMNACERCRGTLESRIQRLIDAIDGKAFHIYADEVIYRDPILHLLQKLGVTPAG